MIDEPNPVDPPESATERESDELTRARARIRDLEAALEDAAKRKVLDEELRQTQKLDSLALLAGSIAHDFNDLLSIVTSNAELAGYKLPEDSDLGEDLDAILTATERAAELTRQLLSFARHEIGHPVELDVGEAVLELEKPLRGLLDARHELVIERAPGRATIMIDRGQLEQVLGNLVRNAREAMPGGGRVTVAVTMVGPGLAPAGLASRAAAVICVSDVGGGIPPDLLERVFEPFFTTKKARAGAGLGLATVHGLVRQSDGEVRISSVVGRGTEVRVYLPLLAALPAGAEQPSSFAHRTSVGFGDGQTILVVDDDDVLRSVTVRMLSKLGYNPLEAADGFAALELIDQRQGHVDLLLTDVVMPRMRGRELARRVRKRWPQIRLMIASGHTQDDDDPWSGWADAMLDKPFNMTRLKQAVRELLNRE